MTHKLVALLLVAVLANPTCCCCAGIIERPGEQEQAVDPVPSVPVAACPACAQLEETPKSEEPAAPEPHENQGSCPCARDDAATAEKPRLFSGSPGFELPQVGLARPERSLFPRRIGRTTARIEEVVAIPPSPSRCVLYSRFLC